MLYSKFPKIIILTLGVCLSACNLNDVTSAANNLGGEEIDNIVVESAEGARWIYFGAVARFMDFFALQAMTVGQFTDELMGANSALSTRQATTLSSPHAVQVQLYSAFQSTRVQLDQALQLLYKHGRSDDANMIGHALGLLGMVHLMIADNFCSGIPVSTSKWGGEFIPSRGFTTTQLYEEAIVYADSGLALGVDSFPVTTLLLGVKARALNALGQFSAASGIAHLINDSSKISEVFIPGRDSSYLGRSPSFLASGRDTSLHVINNKGTNGLRWIPDDVETLDARLMLRSLYPHKPKFFFSNRVVSFFDGAEARLIEAEYYLDLGDIDAYLEMINRVRRMFRYENGLPLSDTIDPGTEVGRIDLLFKERAYTLYLTGRRLGDMRRMVNQYRRSMNDVYPVGPVEGVVFEVYGSNYVFVPEISFTGREETYNPLYNGCESYVP